MAQPLKFLSCRISMFSNPTKRLSSVVSKHGTWRSTVANVRYSILPGPKVIQLFSCSAQLSTKIQLFIKTKIRTSEEVSCFKSLRCVFMMLINVKMSTIVGILTFMSRINFMLS